MPWTKKDHYGFNEIAERWHLTPKELGYSAERDLLEVQTWLSNAVVAVHVSKKMADGEPIPVQVGLSSLTGYFIVEPGELRRVFRTDQPVEVRRFISLDRQEMYTMLYNVGGYMLSTEALEISDIERNRFEIEHNLKKRTMPTNKTGISTSSVGRPSVRKRLAELFEERLAQGKAEATLPEEARYLYAWAQSEWGVERAPALKTITNNLRPHYASQKSAKW
jgi:hypothetical protein